MNLIKICNNHQQNNNQLKNEAALDDPVICWFACAVLCAFNRIERLLPS